MREGARWGRSRHLDAPGEGREGARGQAEHGEEVARRVEAFFGLADAEGGGAQGPRAQAAGTEGEREAMGTVVTRGEASRGKEAWVARAVCG